MQKTVAPAHDMMRIVDSHEARRIIRAGEYTGHTAGIAPDFVQGNLCILPLEAAQEFAAFCQRNPKPCPVIGMGSPGDPSLPDLGDIDIRTDVPRYRVFKDGKLVDEPTDIRKYWSEDLRHLCHRLLVLLRVADAAGGHPSAACRRATPPCRCTARNLALRAGRPLQGQDGGVDAAAVAPADAIRAVQITSRFPRRARCAGASGSSRGHRHRGHRRGPTSAIRRDRDRASCRCSGPAG